MKDFRKLSTLHNYEKNPRSIKKDDFEQLKKHIQQFGQMQPLVITEDGEVLGGNMRLRSYKELGIDDIWVEVVTPKDEADKLAISFILNSRAGFYDADLLANLIPDYPEFDWSQYSVDIKEPQSLQDLIDSLTPVEEDDVPAIAEGEPESKLGKVYQLGRHRLMVGDATKIEDVEKLMDGQKADVSFTSPPYNVGKNAKLSFQDAKDNKYEEYNDENPEYYDLLNISTQNMLDNSEFVFVNLQQLAGNKRDVINWLENYRDNFVDVMIWNKTHAQPAMADKVLNCEFEFVYIFRNKELPNRAIGFKQFRGTLSNVYTAPPQRDNEFADKHAATFPVHFPTHFINNFTNEGQSVLDIFGGTGTTLIACEQTNRTCYMMELSPAYSDVIRKRYDNFVNNSKGATNG